MYEDTYEDIRVCMLIDMYVQKKYSGPNLEA